VRCTVYVVSSAVSRRTWSERTAPGADSGCVVVVVGDDELDEAGDFGVVFGTALTLPLESVESDVVSLVDDDVEGDDSLPVDLELDEPPFPVTVCCFLLPGRSANAPTSKTSAAATAARLSTSGRRFVGLVVAVAIGSSVASATGAATTAISLVTAVNS